MFANSLFYWVAASVDILQLALTVLQMTLATLQY